MIITVSIEIRLSDYEIIIEPYILKIKRSMFVVGD